MIDMKRILDLAVKMDAKQARTAISIFEGRLRELDEPPTWKVVDPLSFVQSLSAKPSDAEPMTANEHREHDDPRWREATAHLPHSGVPSHEGGRDECETCDARYDLIHKAFLKREGAELQAGLEEAVRRERTRLDADLYDPDCPGQNGHRGGVCQHCGGEESEESTS